MKRVRLIASASTLAILGLLAANVGAQQSNTQERTFLTFSSAVEMPGVVLEPGTYEFRLADTPQRNVVQVFTKDRDQVMGQWTFVQSQRERVSDETVVMFRESAEGTTPAVQYWYYPGEKIGKEFVYPKDQAQRIAARTGQQVRTEDGVVGANAAERADNATPAQTGSPAAGAVATSGREADADARISADADAADTGTSAQASTRQQPSAAAQPTAPAGSTTGNRGVTTQASASADRDADAAVRAADTPNVSAGAQAQSQQTQAAASQPRAAAADEARPVGTTGVAQNQADQGQFRGGNELPRTASPLALTGLIGLLSLAGAAGVRRFYS